MSSAVTQFRVKISNFKGRNLPAKDLYVEEDSMILNYNRTAEEQVIHTWNVISIISKHSKQM